jgi:hypothetical protein|tara:strand:+ start:70 stop:276 length:207 start_codon:yes stop_codon:yes gene_type:complete
MSKVKCTKCDTLISKGANSLCATCRKDIEFFHSIMLRMIEDGVIVSTSNGNNVRKVVDQFHKKLTGEM